MKRLNVRFASILFILVTVSVTTVVLLRNYQVKKNTAGLIRRAEEAAADGKHREAMQLRRRYLQYQKEDNEQFAKFALDYLAFAQTPEASLRDQQGAYSVVEDALRRAENDVELRKKAVNYLMRVGAFKVAADHLEFLAKSPDNLLDAKLKVQLAQCYFQTGQFTQSAELLAGVIGLEMETDTFDQEAATSPNDIGAYVLLAAFFRDQEMDRDRGVLVANQMVKANPESAEAYYQRARFLEGTDLENRLDLAKEDVKKAHQLAPDDPDVVLANAEIIRAEGDLERAEEYLSEELPKHDDISRFYLELSEISELRGDRDRSMDWVTKGLEKIPAEHMLLFRKTELEMGQGDIETARESIETLTKSGVLPEWTDYLTARAHMMDRKWAQAGEILEKARPRLIRTNPNMMTQIDVHLGTIYERLGQWDRALSFYGGIPTTIGLISPKWGVIRCQVALGRHDEAVVGYKTLIEELEANEDAKTKLNPTRLRTDLLGILTVLQLQLPEDGRDWREADEVFQLIRRDANMPRERKAEIARDYRLAKGDVEGADRLTNLATETFSKDVSWRMRKVQDSFETNGPEAALEELRKIQDEFGDNPAFRLAEARIIVKRGGADVKSQLTNLEHDVDEWTDTQKMQLWNGLADLYYELRDYDRVHQLGMLVADTAPDDPSVHSRFFELFLEMGDEEGMSGALADIQNILGEEDSTSRLTEARFLVWQVKNEIADKSNLDDARRLVEMIKEKRPDWHLLSRLEAEMHLIDQDVEQAIIKLERSLAQGNPEPRLIRYIAEQYVKMNRYDLAKQWLNRLNATDRTKLDDRFIYELNHLSSDGDLEELNRITSSDSNDATELLFRGKMLARAGKIADAEKSLRRVVQLASRSQEAWLSLVRFYLNHNKRDDAVQAIRMAELKLPEQQIPLALGECHELAARIGGTTLQEQRRHIAASERFYLMALHADPENLSLQRILATFYILVNNDSKAIKYLEQIMDGGKSDGPDLPLEVTWARRARARLLAASGSYQDYLEAIEMIELNRSPGGSLTPDDILEWARMTLPRPDSLSRQKVIGEWNQVSNNRDLTESERMMLAQLLERDGQWDEAQFIMEEMVALYRDRQNIISLYVEMLVRHDQLDKAQVFLDRMDKDSPHTTRIQAYILAHQGREADAVKLLMDMIPDPLPRERFPLLRNIAVLLEDIDQLEAAEKLLRRYYELEPQREMVLVSFLGRNPELAGLDEALDRCEKALNGDDYRPDAITQIGVHTLRSHRSTFSETDMKLYFNRVERWFDLAQKKSPGSNDLLLQRAEFEQLKRNFDQTEQYYRRFIESDGVSARQQAIVKNNLAYLLAIRGKGQEAFKLVDEAIGELGPTSDLLDTRAMAHMAVGDYRKAVRDLRVALRSGDSAAKLFHLAYAQLLSRNEQEARNSLNQARDLGLKPALLSEPDREMYEQLLEKLGSDPNVSRQPDERDALTNRG